MSKLARFPLRREKEKKRARPTESSRQVPLRSPPRLVLLSPAADTVRTAGFQSHPLRAPDSDDGTAPAGKIKSSQKGRRQQQLQALIRLETNRLHCIISLFFVCLFRTQYIIIPFHHTVRVRGCERTRTTDQVRRHVPGPGIYIQTYHAFLPSCFYRSKSPK